MLESLRLEQDRDRPLVHRNNSPDKNPLAGVTRTGESMTQADIDNQYEVPRKMEKRESLENVERMFN